MGSLVAGGFDLLLTCSLAILDVVPYEKVDDVVRSYNTNVIPGLGVVGMKRTLKSWMTARALANIISALSLQPR